MIRGTTAQFKFKLPCTKGELLWATIKFWQRGNTGTVQAPLPITKKLIHCDAPDGSTELYVSLTAEETARFSDKYKAYVQFRAQNATNGTVFGTKPQLVTVYPMLDEILDEDPMLPDANDDGWIVLDGKSVTTEDGLTVLDGESINV